MYIHFIQFFFNFSYARNILSKKNIYIVYIDMKIFNSINQDLTKMIKACFLDSINQYGDLVKVVGDLTGASGTLARIVNVKERLNSLSRTVDDAANIERPKLFNKNRPLNINDPSENDALYSELSNGSYTYASLLAAIGQMTYLNDLTVPNATSITSQSNQPGQVYLNLLLQQNKTIPTELNVFEPKIQNLMLNQALQPYVQAYNSLVFTNANEPQTYEPSEFLNISTTQSPAAILTNTNLDPMDYLLNTGKQPLKDETLLMNIAALELKFNFESRIRRAIERETLGRSFLDEALYNPSTALSLLKDPRSWFELNYDITVSSNPIGKAAEFVASLAGVESPISLIPDIREDYTPKCFGNEIDNTSAEKSNFSKFVSDLLGRTARQQPDVYYLNHTGAGQKYQLFSNIKRNKYSPNYLADYQSGVFQLGEKIAQELRSITGFLGLGAGSRPTGNFYIGNRDKHEDPLYLMQDGDGDIVRSNEKLTESLKKSNSTARLDYEEPGYDEVSSYGNIQTDFIWKDQFARDTILAKDLNSSVEVNVLNKVKNQDNLSFNKYYSGRFRECSILYKTSQLLEKTNEVLKKNGFNDMMVMKRYDPVLYKYTGDVFRANLYFHALE